MSKTEDKRLKKLAGLLRKADDARGTPEELVYRAKFAELAAKWGIASDRVAAFVAGDQGVLTTEANSRTIVLRGKYRQMQAVLLGSVAQAIHAYGVQVPGYRVQIFGMDEHLERIEGLFSLLRDDMLHNAHLAGAEMRRYGPGRLRVFRKSYMVGYISQSCDLIRNAERKAAREAGAVVLFTSDQERAEKKMLETYPDVEYQKKLVGGDIDPEGYMRGLERAATSGLV